MGFLQQGYRIVVENPWFFLGWIGVVASAAWTVIHFIYRYLIDQNDYEIKRIQGKISDANDDIAKKRAAR